MSPLPPLWHPAAQLARALPPPERLRREAVSAAQAGLWPRLLLPPAGPGKGEGQQEPIKRTRMVQRGRYRARGRSYPTATASGGPLLTGVWCGWWLVSTLAGLQPVSSQPSPPLGQSLSSRR